MAITLTLIRHTKVHNPDKICYGNFDIALHKSFEKEKITIKNTLAQYSFDAVYSSPLSRCTKLANFCFPDSHIILHEKLKELNFGTWEGKTWSSIKQETMGFFSNYNYTEACPEGESFFDLIIRLTMFLDTIQETYNANSHIAIFTHGGPIRAVTSIIKNIAPMDTFNQKVEYGDIIQFKLEK